jgi:thiamine biosynthesis protein ThiI
MKDFEYIVVHYDEIGLKASNRGQFEQLLTRNMRHKLGDMFLECRREPGQLTLRLRAGADAEDACMRLSRVPGIAYVSPSVRVSTDIGAFMEHGMSLLRGCDFTTFKIDAHRHNKTIELGSMEVNRELGTAVLEAFDGKVVNLDHPEAVLKIEMTGPDSYLSVDRIGGVGGLPTDPRQKVVTLVSGGIDSPVAAYLMMKRGCQVVLVHFQNRSEMTNSVQDKVEQLARQLSHFQVKTILHVVPFGDLQKEIVKHVHSTQRMLIYKRLMLKMSARVAEKAKARFLVTGDCLSQVASQTYENLEATYSGIEMPILTPTIGMDKRDIVALARRIGTYEISTLPYEDCCTFFVPKHPELRATPASLCEQESRMDLTELVEEALREVKAFKW